MRYIPYGRHTIDKEDIETIVKVLKSDWITQGPKIKEFEEALCAYTGAKYAVAVSSGTAALHIACLAAGIKKNEEVIISPITFVASANCVLYCGGRPVFADVQEDTINVDPEEIKKQITSKTRAIIPVHFAGQPCDLEEISKIAKKYNLLIIEDASHALGAKYKGSRIGSCNYSDMAVFSFHPVKSITTGEGGAVLTNRQDLYESLLLLRNHGITKNPDRFINFSPLTDGPWYYEMLELGFNYRITDFQCALGINQLRKLGKFLQRRREIANFYNKELSKIGKVILPAERPYVKSSWHLYYIRLKDTAKRKQIFEELRECEIGVQVHYIPLHLHPYYKNKFGFQKKDFPVAEQYYSSALSLPIFPRMTDREIEKVINSLRDCLDAQ